LPFAAQCATTGQGAGLSKVDRNGPGSFSATPDEYTTHIIYVIVEGDAPQASVADAPGRARKHAQHGCVGQ